MLIRHSGIASSAGRPSTPNTVVSEITPRSTWVRSISASRLSSFSVRSGAENIDSMYSMPSALVWIIGFVLRCRNASASFSGNQCECMSMVMGVAAGAVLREGQWLQIF